MNQSKFSTAEVDEEMEALKKARASEAEQEPIYKSNVPQTDLKKVLHSD